MKPIVSVIMPTYKHARFLSQSISSVLKQSYENLELIVIDNYSNDNTEEIVGEFQKHDSRVIYKKFANKGIIAASRNFGIKHSRGEHIAFLDSDDIWLKNKLRDQITAIQSEEDVGLVYTKMISFDRNGRLLRVSPKKGASGSVFKKLLMNNFTGSSTVLVKKDVLKKVGLFNEDPDLVSVEDYELWLRIAYSYKFSFVKKIYLKYRIHAQNLSFKEEHLRNRQIIYALQSVLIKFRISKNLQNKVLSHWYTTFARKALLLNNYSDFKSLSRKAFAINFNLLAYFQVIFASIIKNNYIQLLLDQLKKVTKRQNHYQ